jgi:hypothetical protein
MSSRIRAHIQSNVVGYIALFFAVTGVAWAARIAPKNSVATKSIKNKAVTTAKLANGAVTGSKVAPATLNASNFAPGTLGGGITDVHAGNGLSGGGSSGSVTLSADQAVLQHRLDGGCPSGQAIRSVDQNGNSSCDSFIRGSGQGVLLDNALTTGTSPVTVADLGFINFQVQCTDNGVNTGTIQLVARVPAGGQTHLIYADNGNGTVAPVVVNPNSSMPLGQVSNGFGKEEFSVGNAGFPGAGSGDASGTVYLNASFQNSTGTCNDLGYILSS